jgi:hypothetical protein
VADGGDDLIDGDKSYTTQNRRENNDILPAKRKAAEAGAVRGNSLYPD